MPAPRRKTTIFTGFSANNIPKNDPVPQKIPSGRYSIISSSIIASEDVPIEKNPMITSTVEVTLKPIDVMSISWAPDMGPLEEIRQKRLRIPIRPKTLVVTSVPSMNPQLSGSTRALDVSTTFDLTPMSKTTTLSEETPYVTLDKLNIF